MVSQCDHTKEYSSQIKGERVDTREKIMMTAYEVFVEKGFAGARTQEIADRAGVNKAMLHYYFGNKENLYAETIIATLGKLFAEIRPAFDDSGFSDEDRLRRFVTGYVDFISANPGVPRLLVQDILSGNSKLPGLFETAFERVGVTRTFPMVAVLEKGIERGTFRPLSIQHTLISIIGMSLFYFIGKPIVDRVLEVDDADTTGFLEARKENIVEILLHGILTRRGDDRVGSKGAV